MRLVDRYVRLSKECRASALKTPDETLQKQFDEAAAAWESLAKERLRLLQLQTEIEGPPGQH
jgi:hypothetical protein